MNNKQKIEMTLTALPDGTSRMTNLKIGDPNKRYWQYNERGHIVWESHPEAVTVPDGVSVIGQLSCPILGEIILPPGVKEIDDLAFGAEFYTGDTYEWYALRTIHLSGGLYRIGYRAFYNCQRLDGVRLPKGLTKIHEDAFRLCRSLSRITIPESVDHLGYAAFCKCDSLTEAIFRDGLKIIGGAVFMEDVSLKKVILPKTLVRIGSQCFSGCTSLPEIDLPESLTELGEYAFEGCKALTSFRFRRDLENKEEMHSKTPFKDCTVLTEFYLDNAVTRADWIPSAPTLKSINVAADHPHFKSVDGVLYSKDKKTLLRVPSGIVGEFTVPRTVTSIGSNAFRGSRGITEVILPSSVTTVGDGAFADCAALGSIDLPGKLTEVGKGAFRNCTSLSHIHVSGSVRHIGDGAFDGCKAIESITVSPENKYYRAEGTKLIAVNK